MIDAKKAMELVNRATKNRHMLVDGMVATDFQPLLTQTLIKIETAANDGQQTVVVRMDNKGVKDNRILDLYWSKLGGKLMLELKWLGYTVRQEHNDIWIEWGVDHIADASKMVH